MTDSNAANTAVERRRRLQRPADFTGDRIETFTAVVLRHGLPGAALGLLCLMLPGATALLDSALQDARQAPLRYAASGLLILAALTAYAAWLDGRWQPRQLGWALYLGAVSAWEEWVFRVALPYSVEAAGGPFWPTVLACNLAFGAAHYFTLRWRWPWCVAAFLGGLALSRQMHLHFDLAWIIAIHWLATFLNTPRPPSPQAPSG